MTYLSSIKFVFIHVIAHNIIQMKTNLGNTMSNKGYSRFYRQFTQKLLDKIVTPQVLGNTTELEKNIEKEREEGAKKNSVEEVSKRKKKKKKSFLL